MVEPFGPFIEVFVDTSVDECARRDVKGLYAKAFAGEITEFTGVSDPYEAPSAPDVHIRTEQQTPQESAARIIAELEALGLVNAVVPTSA
jgi:adenylylsulfate kinase-like enzyme